MVDVVRVRVTAGARKNEVKKENNTLKVYVSPPAVEGKANKAVLGLLAKYFGCRKSEIKIVKGERSKNKFIQIKYN